MAMSDEIVAAIASGDMVAGRACKWCQRNGVPGPLVQVVKGGVFHMWQVGYRPPKSQWTSKGIWTRCGYKIGNDRP